jgi:hypothetical protein
MATDMNYKTLGELEEKYYGKPGTPEREQKDLIKYLVYNQTNRIILTYSK